MSINLEGWNMFHRVDFTELIRMLLTASLDQTDWLDVVGDLL